MPSPLSRRLRRPRLLSPFPLSLHPYLLGFLGTSPISLRVPGCPPCQNLVLMSRLSLSMSPRRDTNCTLYGFNSVSGSRGLSFSYFYNAIKVTAYPLLLSCTFRS
jgi:hypothetical protein